MISPITPPLELVQQWSDIKPMEDAVVQNWVKIATQAARWGADQELEACEKWVAVWISAPEASQLYAARRPKVPSKAESALNALEHILRHSQTDHGANTIRLALEQLKKLEALDD